MYRRCLPLLVPALLLAVPQAPATAAPASGARASVSVHGIRLTLTLPGRTFPADALVPVTMTARNTTRHTLWLLGGGPMSPGKSLPQVEALKNGTVVYPPALPFWLPLPGPGPELLMLNPGKTLRTVTYVILRGPQVRATLQVTKSRNSIGKTLPITTPSLSVALTAADPPAVTMQTTPGGSQAEITPPAGVTGKPLYEDATVCSGTVGGAQTLFWTRAARTTFTPGCAPTQQWHVVVGWPGHSVASIDVPAASTSG